jgi:indole-3-glycerol phosphate synthase
MRTMTTSVLEAIMAGSRRSAFERARTSRVAVERQAASASPRGAEFATALAQPGIQIIAECKRRSPSKGVLKRDYDPARIASGYARAGAAAISVLTEPSFFDGHLDHLRAVRAAVGVPLLRKDFMATEFQLVEARAAGADAVLLIVAALRPVELASLLAGAAKYGLAALVEVHTTDEVRIALDHGATLVGVNSRDLQTLAVSLAVFDQIAPMIPAGVTRVAESGISTPADIRYVRQLGFDAVLIGERFMATDDPGASLQQFTAATTGAASS